MLRSLLWIAFAIAFFSFLSTAQATPEKIASFTTANTLNPLEITSVEVVRISTETAENSSSLLDDCSQPIVNSADIGWGTVVTVGEKIWSIVESNKPSIHLRTPIVHALPHGHSCWSNLEHWQRPTIQTYEVIYKNGFDTEVIKFEFRLHYTAGGGLGKKGQYLANVSVIPSDVNVLWGFTIDAEVAVGEALNLGTVENPLAGLEINLTWKTNSLLKATQDSKHFFIQGNGVLQTLN